MKPSPVFHEAALGMKLSATGVITAIYPGGPAERAGLWIDDKIISVNGIESLNELGKWIQFFDTDNMTFVVNRQHQILNIDAKADGTQWFKHYTVVDDPSNEENYANLQKWMKVKRLNKEELNQLA